MRPAVSGVSLAWVNLGEISAIYLRRIIIEEDEGFDRQAERRRDAPRRCRLATPVHLRIRAHALNHSYAFDGTHLINFDSRPPIERSDRRSAPSRHPFAPTRL